ncbi:zinc-dependent metalloprotease [Winogradskyella schleiferi]|uniref:zinc-dependent metalloprotease n=1 Tax=Winogradskyella schleiferi TaxID=2686078 RepID=UPI0015BD4EC3|nr:zinc-dependent metalloprotease [Winogradskyella schleiferi]
MKPTKYPFLSLLVMLSFTLSFAQNQCGFDAQREQQRQDPNFVSLERAAEKRLQKAIANRSFSRMAGEILTIPVVIHVLHLGEAEGTGSNISDAQIQSSIDNLNDYYRGQVGTSPIDFEIEFVLAQRDPDCNATTGINRIDASGVTNYTASGVSLYGGSGADQDTLKDLSRWPETDYFNIWIVTEINGNNGGSGYQGYANFYYGNTREGSVMMYTVFGYDPSNSNPSWPLSFSRDNSTVGHEAGHYFHLYHTFQGDGTGSDCPADTTIGTDSDGCADTVPHKRETSTCPVTNDCTGNPWINNNTINNIMSYYSCADRLTNDQKTRVRAAMEGTSLANSKGSQPLDPTYVAPVAVCSNNTTSTNSAGIISVELNGVSFTSYSSASDGGNIDNSSNCSNYFEIDASLTNTLNVGMFPVNYQQLGVWIDWNDDGDFNDGAEQQHLSQDIPGESTVSVNLVYPTTIPYGDYVRVRFITELDDRHGSGVLNSACYSLLSYGQSEDYTIYVKPSGSTTYTYNNGWLPNDPNGISGASDDIIVETGSALISTNTTCNSLTVDPGAALTVNSGITLTTNESNLNSTSQIFSSLIVDGTITGTVNYNRHTAQIGTNDLISAPVVDQTFGSFETANPNLATSGTLRAFAPYVTSAGAFQNYDTSTNASTIINAGTGYKAATTDGSTLTFTGTVRTNDVLDVPISDATAGSAWNLIGNPYPSYMNFETFFTTNAGEFDPNNAFQAIYGYDGNGGWTVWNFSSIVDISADEYLAPGQAFFVKAKSGGGLVDFTTNMRTTGTSDDFIAGRDSSTTVALCQLNLNSSSNNASTKIYFIEGTTRGLDFGYDAGSYSGSTAEYSIFSNLVEDNSGLDMAIQALPFNDLNDVIIPIGIKAQANEQLTISIDDVSYLPSGVNVYLNDTVENAFTLLNTSDYTFTASNDLTGTGRFYIQYATQTLSVNNDELNNLNIYATSTPKEIVVKGLLVGKSKANLYDIQGRLVLNECLDVLNTSNRIDVSSLSSGIYVISIFSDNKSKTQKLIIK